MSTDILNAAASSPAVRKRLFWRLQCAGWVGIGLLTTVFISSGQFPVQATALLGLFRAVFGFAATSLLRLVYRRLKHAPGSIWTRGALVFLLCGLTGFADALAAQELARLMGVDMESAASRLFLFASPILRWVLYWLWSVLYFGICYWLDTQQALLRATQALASARESELRLLRAQVNPHFLFNALNSILAESANPASVRALVLALAQYLRFSFKQNADIEPLGVELDALENYLKVEKARFEENLDYRIEATDEARATLAPIALVQPLLENAIKYGQRSEIRPVGLVIHAEVTDDYLKLQVTNTGVWVEPGSHDSTGTGLDNLRRRLSLLYGKEASLETAVGDGKVRVHVRLPLRKDDA